MTQAATFCTAVSLSGGRLRSYSRVMAALPVARPVPRRADGSIVYLHGVGGVRPAWWRPMSRGLGGLHVDLSAPAYEDLLTTPGRVYARRTSHDVAESRDDDRRAYVLRQHRLAELVQSVGESTRMAWPAGLAAALADRLLGCIRSLRVKLPSERTIAVTISAGAAVSLPDESAEELIARADRSLYASKRAGRNRWCVATAVATPRAA